MRRVLVIDDDSQIRRLLRLSLSYKDFEVFEAGNGFEGLQNLRAVRPDIVLLDLSLPDTDGAEVLKEIRAWSGVPVIVLSVRKSESDIVGLLNEGADDYVVKPFNTNELMARMNAALRHARPETGSPSFRTGNLEIDFDSRKVRLGDSELRLTPTEFSILSLLARNAGRIVTQDYLLKELWGPLSDVESGSLRVHISSIRKKIETDPSHPTLLRTEPGIGFRLERPVE